MPGWVSWPVLGGGGRSGPCQVSRIVCASPCVWQRAWRSPQPLGALEGGGVEDKISVTTRLCRLCPLPLPPGRRPPRSLDEVQPGEGVPGVSPRLLPPAPEWAVEGQGQPPSPACLHTPHGQGFACLRDGVTGTRQSLSSALRCPRGGGVSGVSCLPSAPSPAAPGLPSPISPRPRPHGSPGSAVSLSLPPVPGRQLALTPRPGSMRPDRGRFARTVPPWGASVLATEAALSISGSFKPHLGPHAADLSVSSLLS